jgi:uncharacterized protein (TIGR00369 family)
MSARDDKHEVKRAWFREHWQHSVLFNAHLGIDFVSWEPGAVTARMPFDARFTAHESIFHGGVVATLIDTTGSGAVISGHDFDLGSRLTTVSMTVNYLSVAPGEDLVAEGVCTRRGRSLNFARVEVRGAQGKLVAEGLLTVNISGKRAGVP